MRAARRAASAPPRPVLARGRLSLLGLAVVLFAAALAAKLVTLQVGQHEALAAMASREHLQTEEVPARRGDVFDAAGSLLATNVTVYRVYASTADVKDPERAERELGPLLGLPTGKVREVLASRQSGYLRLGARVDADRAERIRALRLAGIFLEPEPKRVYPRGAFAAHVLGFANDELSGAYGVEGFYDEAVRGRAGSMTAERDTAGNPIAIGARLWQPAVDGEDLTLTILASVQHLAERELAAAVERYGASGGTILVMDPASGAIMALANWPGFDPNAYGEVAPERWRDPAISDTYEPGSTFKIITMAAGLQTGAVTPTTRHVCTGQLQVGGFTIRNWDGQAHGSETMTEVLLHSCNVGAAFVSNRVGADDFYRLVREFGFGQPTGVDLQGEAAGTVRWPDGPRGTWGQVDLATNAFGQGLSVTPLQLAAAVSAVANGGNLVKPYVVERVGRDGQAGATTHPAVVRRVLSPQTARALSQMLVTVVRQGETPLAKISGYSIAAKTGTASIPTAGGYDPKAVIASTIAFAPAENPRFTVLVKLDRPTKAEWGAEVAAPVVARVVQELVLLLGLPPAS